MQKGVWLAALALTASIASPAAFAQTESPAPTPAPAQTPSPAPPGPPPCTGPEHRQFDFWVGDWNVNGPKGRQVGTNRIEKIMDGCVVQENWAGQGNVKGTSFNVYDTTDKKWHQVWVDNQGSLLLLEGGIKDGKMEMTGETTNPKGEKVMHRITWEPQADSKVRQHWLSSPDGGKTWNTAFDGVYNRKP